ncbi:MAG: T9SS type A sorting domain-containing protein [Ignavibacteria bacterium]|nr:T9SS type A sorting domain-containing protein [Ignavibacteria bacterium]
MKKILFILLVLTSVVSQFAYGTTYYSQGSVTPTTTTNWNSVRAGGGSSPANFTSGDIFVIQNGHTMTTSATWSVSGTGSKIQIESGGNLVATSAITVAAATTFQIDNGGTYTHSNTSAFGSTIMAGTESFGNSSTVIFTDWNSTGPSVSSWGNVKFNATGTVAGSIQFSGALTTINGNLEILATGTGTVREVRLATTGSYTMTIGGDLIVSGGIIDLASGATGGTRTISIGGNFNMSGGTFKQTNTTATSLSFTGTGKTYTQSAGTFTNTNMDWNVNSGASVTMANNWSIATSKTLTVAGTLDCSTLAVTGAGAFTLSTNGTLKLGNTAGLSSTASTGAIQVTGTRTYNATGVTIEYNGSSAQNTGNQFPASLKNFTVSNAAGVTLDASATISGTANVTGLLQLGTNNMTQTGGAATLSGTGTIKLDGVFNTQVGTYNTNTFQTNGTYQFNGTNQDVPSGSYKNITVNGGDAQLTGNVSLSGVLAVNGTLTLGANKLTFTGSSPTRTAEGIDASNTNAEIEFNSAGTITLPASLFTGDIGKLTMTGSGLVTSSDNINVTNALTLTNGFLNMGANTLTLGTSTSNEGTYSRTSGTIRGTFKRWIASGASTKEFPLDNGSGALSMATVTFTSLGTGGTLTAKFNNSGSGTLSDNGGLGYLATGPSMSNVNLINLAPQYWTITAGDGLATPNYSIDITGDGVPNISEINYIAIVKRADNTQPWAWNSGNHSTTTGSTSNPILHGVSFTSFSEFGVGGNVDNLLPVELSSFTSAVAGRNVTLSWSTGNEQNNSGFDIERKSTVTEWVKIGNVEGHGTVNTPNSYSFNDNALSSGRYSYRLKQIDYNGNFRYYYLSNEINIGAPSKYSLSQNYPNPFNPVTTISYEIPNADFVALKVYDMTGKEVASLVNEKQDAGFYSIRFDASRLSSGVYFYTLKSSDFVSTKKLILVK